VGVGVGVGVGVEQGWAWQKLLKTQRRGSSKQGQDSSTLVWVGVWVGVCDRRRGQEERKRGG